MSPPRLSAADALLRLWMLTALAMAGLQVWLAWRMRDWPADLPGPQPLRAVQISEFMALFVLAAAAVVITMRWRATRDRPLLVMALTICALWLWSFLAWEHVYAQAPVLAGDMIRLHITDAAIALAGLPIALRALRLR